MVTPYLVQTVDILKNSPPRLIQVAGHGHLTLSIWSGSPSAQSGLTAIHKIEHIWKNHFFNGRGRAEIS